MRRSTKAALVSGLVFPGLGHILVRKYVFGLVLLCLAGWSVYAVAAGAIGTALDVAKEIESGSIVLDSETLSELVAQRSQRAEESTKVPLLVLLVTWVIGIVDSYRAGRAQERLEE